MAVSAPRFLDLPSALQALWSQVFAAVVGASRVGSVLEPEGDAHLGDMGEAAERLAWEAVRRASGGELPPARSAVRAPDGSTLGERLQSAIKSRHSGSQNELERKAGLSSGTLSMLVNDRRQRPNLGHVQALAKALGVSFEWLATGRGASSEQ